MASPPALTDKEAELYDRQIRLWGVEAQQRMRSALVFIVGLSALGAEVAKNLILAGFSVTLLDASPAAPRDLGAQFFLDPSSLGHSRALASQPRAQDLNRLVRVSARGCGLSGVADSELSAFPPPLVVLCDQPAAELVAACARCRALGAPVLAASSYGLWGALFQDAGAARAFERSAPAAGGEGGEGATAAAALVPLREEVAFKPLEEVLSARTFTALAANKRAQPAVYAWVGAFARCACVCVCVYECTRAPALTSMSFFFPFPQRCTMPRARLAASRPRRPFAHLLRPCAARQGWRRRGVQMQRGLRRCLQVGGGSYRPLPPLWAQWRLTKP